MKIGYARVSTQEQKTDLQVDALKKAGVDKIFIDKISGTTKSRPEFDRMLDMLREGDCVVIWKLDRLGRSLIHLVSLIQNWEQQGIGLESINDSINTSSASGKLIFNVFASLAQFERDLVIERTRAGLEAARARGRIGGRPIKLNDDRKKAILSLYDTKQHTVKEICAMFDIAKPTFYRYLKGANS